MGEGECRNGATDFLVVGGSVVLVAILIVIAVSYFAGRYTLLANFFLFHNCPVAIWITTLLPNLTLIVIKGENLNPGSFFSSPFLFIKSCLLLVIASTQIWVCFLIKVSITFAEYIRWNISQTHTKTRWQFNWQGIVVVLGTYPTWTYDVVEKDSPGFCAQVNFYLHISLVLPSLFLKSLLLTGR